MSYYIKSINVYINVGVCMCMSGRKIKTLTNMVAEILYCFFGNLPQGIRA